MADFYATPLSRSLGQEKVRVAGLIEVHGPVKPGFAEKTGFHFVHRMSEGQNLAEFAVSGLPVSLRKVLPEIIDSLVVVSSSAPRVTPGLGSDIHEILDLSPKCQVITLNDACTGFQTGLNVSRALLNSGDATQVLLVTLDAYSQYFQEADLAVSPLFSDGTSAFLLGRFQVDEAAIVGNAIAMRQRVRSSSIASGLKDLLTIGPLSDQLGMPFSLRMRGGEVFSFVADQLPVVLAASKEELTSEEWSRVLWFVHQGSRLVVNHVESLLGATRDSLFRASQYGNVVSSSIPFQILDHWVDVATNDLIGIISFGVGMNVSASVYEVLGSENPAKAPMADRRLAGKI